MMRMERPLLWGLDDPPIPHRRFASWGDAILAALIADVVSPTEAMQFLCTIHAEYQDRMADIPLMKRRIERLQVQR